RRDTPAPCRGGSGARSRNRGSRPMRTSRTWRATAACDYGATERNWLYDLAMNEAAAPRPNLPEYSVSEISAALKRTVEDAFPFVRVRGEISNLKFHSSGHIYFDLKDEKACLNAVVWR